MSGGLVRRTSAPRTMATRSIQRRVITELAEEDAVAVAVERRISNGMQLAEESVVALHHLSSKISALSVDQPGLEVQLRAFSDVVAMASADLVYKYMRG